MSIFESEHRVRSVAETESLATQLGSHLRPGDVVALVGDLGSGKTVFARALCRALGVREPVTSPTFTLVHEYRGRCPVFHVDLYRVGSLSEAEQLALDEYFDRGGVTIIEWADRAAALLPPSHLRVELDHGSGSEERRIRIQSVRPGGPS